MNKRKYQIFISSTCKDLEEERKALTKAILEVEHIPIGMESFSASDTTQWEYITKRILDTDYYVLIVAHKYGSIDTTTKNHISYTEKEYDFAIENKIPIMTFIIDDEAEIDFSKMEKDGEKLNKLNAFKEKIKTRLCKFYKNEDDLKSHFKSSLPDCIQTSPRPGWVRADDLVVREKMMEVDLIFLKDFFDQKMQLIVNVLLHSFTDRSKGQKIPHQLDLNEFTFNVNEVYSCVDFIRHPLYLGKRAYEMLYSAMKEVKEKILYIMTSPNIKLDYKIIQHFNLYLSKYDEQIIWYDGLKFFSRESEEIRQDIIKGLKNINKIESIDKDRALFPFISYFHCSNFIKDWIINYNRIIFELDLRVKYFLKKNTL